MVSNLIKSKWLIDLEDPKISFERKTIVVTGSSNGLGFEVAKKLAKLNCSHLILAVRDENLGKKAKEEIEKYSGRNENFDDVVQHIEVWQLDLMDHDSIYAFANRVNEEIDCLDAVILNAGVMKAHLVTSKYGWEESLQVNTLSTILLAILLLPKLLSSKTTTNTPVLEIITSSLYAKQHFTTKEQQKSSGGLLESYNKKGDAFNPFSQYNSSKLLSLYAFTHLVSKFKPDQIRIIFVSPGFVATQLGREFNIPLSTILKPIFSTIFQRNVDQGSRSYISGLLQGIESHGKIWQHDQLKPFTPNEMVDEEGNDIPTLIWKAVINTFQKIDHHSQLEIALSKIP